MVFFYRLQSLNIKYKKPAFYDDEIKVRVIIKELPKVRFKFYYETYNSNDELLNTGFYRIGVC